MMDKALFGLEAIDNKLAHIFVMKGLIYPVK